MLALKLVLVPLFLLGLSLASKYWGPSVAGWLAGLPVVAGPILFFLAVEHGATFAAASSTAALSAVLASVAFSLAYAHAATRAEWPLALVIALLAWGLAAASLAQLPSTPALALLVSLATLVLAPYLFPSANAQSKQRAISGAELCLRMLAGAVLTLGVTMAAGEVGGVWSGLLAVFPVLGIVLAVFSHRLQGAAFAAALLRSMAKGLFSFVAFCFVLAVTLPRVGIAAAFAVAIFLALVVQAVTKRRLAPDTNPPLTINIEPNR